LTGSTSKKESSLSLFASAKTSRFQGLSLSAPRYREKGGGSGAEKKNPVAAGKKSSKAFFRGFLLFFIKKGGKQTGVLIYFYVEILKEQGGNLFQRTERKRKNRIKSTISSAPPRKGGGNPPQAEIAKEHCKKRRERSRGYSAAHIKKRKGRRLIFNCKNGGGKYTMPIIRRSRKKAWPRGGGRGVGQRSHGIPLPGAWLAIKRGRIRHGAKI